MNITNSITKQQNKDGSYNSSNGLTKLLTSSLILIELQEIKNDKKINTTKKLLQKWLLNQKNNDWIFSNNLYENFIAITAIQKNAPELISGQDLAKILNILTKAEIKTGGPYHHNLIDNVAIAYFLSLNEVNLPNLDKFIKNRILKIRQKPIDYLSVYLLSQFCNKVILETLITYLRKEVGTLNGLDKFLVSKILNAKQEVPNTTLEKVLSLKISKTITNDYRQNDNLIITKLIKAAKDRFKYLDKDIQKIALIEIQRTIKKNTDKQMSLLTYYFRIALGKNGNKIDDNFIFQTALANIFFWTAFIIYDDFWDEDEKAMPQILPSANLYARHYINFYDTALPDNQEFPYFFHKLMDKLDGANTWETKHCRTQVINQNFIIPKKIPNYKNYDLKFYPASGQVLGPIVILLKLGFKLDSEEINNLVSYFKNYLIAMQIKDDAHDWLEDMQRGHLSTVVAMLIKDWQEKYPEQKEINLITDLKKLQQLFWFKTIKTSSRLTIAYTKKSKQALKKLYFLENLNPLEYFIDISEKTAKAALKERQKSLDFLNEF